MIAGHKKQWNFLKKSFESGQLAHAYLFSGEEKIGKKTLAKEFIEMIIGKENHLDVLTIGLKNDKQEIEILQIREAISFLSYKSYYGSFKAVIIDGAEKMSLEAQNCFLKTLEEPKGKTILILISSHPEVLLPTIISRCQIIKFFPFEKYKISPQEQQTLQELVKIINSNLAEKFQYTKKINLENNNLKGILEILQRYLRHLLFLKIGADNLTQQNYFGETVGSFKNYSVSKIKEILKLSETIYRQTSLTNANPKLALEILLMEM